MRLRYAAATAVVLLVGGLAGCSDDQAPEGSPAPSTSATASATPSAPTLPAEARGTDAKAAEAFVRHYVDLINHATETLDTAPLKAASARGCKGCASIAALYDRVRTDGGEVRGGTWTIRKLVIGEALLARRRVNVLVSYPQQTVRYTSGGKKNVFKPGEALFIFEYRPSDRDLVINKIIGPVQ
jgi:hypothetical protein